MPGTVAVMGAYPVVLASSLPTVTLFLASLAVLAQIGVAVAVTLWVASRLSSSVARSAERVRDAIGPSALWLAWSVAVVSTLGSLYFSEVAGFVPCKLCWFQRICMYPLVVVLGVAAWRQRVEIARPASYLAGIGALIAAYHYLLERFPSLESGVSCDPAAPCSIVWVWRFHYLSIPGMAFSAFALIAILVLIATDPAERNEGDRAHHEREFEAN